MPLDLTKVIAQIGGMLTLLKANRQERREHLRSALDTLHSQSSSLENLSRKIAASRTTWLVAGLVEGLDQHYSSPSLPDEFTVIAVDGSHIDVDRHRPARCYLINIGTVRLYYGASPDASLDSIPQLYSADDDLVILSPDGKGREQPVEGALLGIKRNVEECRRLAGLASEEEGDSPVLALLDGSLIMWSLEASYPEFVIEVLLEKGFLKCLDEMKNLNNKRKVAVASYISFPRSADVVNALRVALCPHEVVDSDRFCSTCETRECDAPAGVQDRELFYELLAPGERSAVFLSQSSVVGKRYGQHRVYFFYLRLEDEIARIEIPEWVALDKELLNLTHSMALDQSRRGHGYPVALSEAHEKAVVTGADREQFWELVESSLADEHLPSLTSAKSFSKRTRWV